MCLVPVPRRSWKSSWSCQSRCLSRKIQRCRSWNGEPRSGRQCRRSCLWTESRRKETVVHTVGKPAPQEVLEAQPGEEAGVELYSQRSKLMCRRDKGVEGRGSGDAKMLMDRNTGMILFLLREQIFSACRIFPRAMTNSNDFVLMNYLADSNSVFVVATFFLSDSNFLV